MCSDIYARSLLMILRSRVRDSSIFSASAVVTTNCHHFESTLNVMILQEYACTNRSKLSKSLKKLPKCIACQRDRSSGGSCRFLGELSLLPIIITAVFTTLQTAVCSTKIQKKYLSAGKPKNHPNVHKCSTDRLVSKILS